MSFRIDRHEEIGNGFRRILAKQLELAIRRLGQPSPETRRRAVHEVRRRIKKIRSVLRLQRAIASCENPKIDKRPLRGAARELAEMRDADVHLGALQKLCRRFGADCARFPRTFRLLECKQRNASARSATLMRQAAEWLEIMRPKIDRQPGGDLEWREVRHGLRRLYKKARTAFQRAANDVSVESMHELAQTHEGCLVRPIAPRNALPETGA